MRIEEHDYGDVLSLSVGQGTLHALAAPLLQHRWEGHCYPTISHLGLAGWDTSWRYGPGWGLEAASLPQFQYHYIFLGDDMPLGNCYELPTWLPVHSGLRPLQQKDWCLLHLPQDQMFMKWFSRSKVGKKIAAVF